MNKAGILKNYYRKPAQTEGEGAPSPIGGIIANPAMKVVADSQKAKAGALDICKEYQANIRITEMEIHAIMKGLNAHEPIESLFLKAMHCISAMQGNPVLYKQAQRVVTGQKGS